MDDTAEQKNIQRRAGIAARKAIPLELALILSEQICIQLAAHPSYKNAGTILSYSPFGGEVDVSFINLQAEQEGKTVAYPICHGGGRMVAAAPEGPAAWAAGKYGILAPIESRSRILAPAEIDLVIVPCTAFDGTRRARAGMGAGYYDRYLPLCLNAAWIAVAYEAQHIPGICCEPWDAALHAVVTESMCYSS
jgi:5-formyltetrahydrofolate cyclo-ligase